jgi:hypothetical protein
VRAIDRHTARHPVPPSWPAAGGAEPNEFGAFGDDAVTEVITYPHDTRPLVRALGDRGPKRRIWGGTSCTLRLVELAGGAWCYGYDYTLREEGMSCAPSAERVRDLFGSRREVLMHAHGHWQSRAAMLRVLAARLQESTWKRHAEEDAREAQKVADWLLSIAGGTRRGEQIGLFA